MMVQLVGNKTGGGGAEKAVVELKLAGVQAQ